MENRYLLISDLDGTLLGDDDALTKFTAWYEPRRDWLPLVYNSGRFVASVLESIDATDLPEPEAIIGGMGTQIQCLRSSTPVGDWPVDCNGWQPLRVCSVLSRYDELELQPAEFLSQHKISYYVHGASPELIVEIRRQLADVSCGAEVVYSSKRDLDVLPQGVNKGSAAVHLAAHWSVPKERVFVSGDTANDLAMFEAGFRGIIVGNADRELKGLKSSLVFQAKQPFAAGVLEGLSHWLGWQTALADSYRTPEW